MLRLIKIKEEVYKDGKRIAKTWRKDGNYSVFFEINHQKSRQRKCQGTYKNSNRVGKW